MIFPTREIIVVHNYRVIQETGGNFFPPENLLHPDSLEWVLEAIQYPLFGVHIYPTMPNKMAILAWTIINDHVFYDGNKRTGMFSLLTFSKINGFEVSVTGDEIIKTALAVANYRDCGFSIDDFASWITRVLRYRA